ncbi:MAG: polyprenyl synthetase family protein [Halobacteriovoraceae bacterium]|jgi:geranylgeranyl pyrophosphate synthase|nr:polyprenyl synthetase family protein [Halobacteriovoraceae bacterium]
MYDLKLDEFYFNDSAMTQELKSIDLSSLKNGKNIRAKLLAITGEIFDISLDDCKKLGRVVEMVHNATLTHDDVIDNSNTRRNAPSVPALINNKKSVLVGDYMLAKALHELSDFQNPTLTQELTLTLKELVEGEWIQYENTNPYEITTSLYETLAIKKTGSLFRWCFLAPIIHSDPKSKHYELLKEFGEKLGIIFQMTDDIIDFNPESKKTFGLDFRNNNINFVMHFIGRDYPELRVQFLRCDSFSDLTKTEQAYFESAIVQAKAVVQNYLTACHSILNTLETSIASDKMAKLDEFRNLLKIITQRVS